jgi:hypothetical protein
MKNNTCLIWDLPTRVFHWLLTVGFIAAAMIAFLTEGKSRLFPYHAVIGLALALLVVLRVIWGFIGLLGVWTLGLVSNFNAAAKTTTLPFLGLSLQFGENEKDKKQGQHPDRQEQKRNHD